MDFFKGLSRAIGNCFKSFGFIFEKGLWPYLFYPVIAWLLIWLVSLWAFGSLAEGISGYINDQLNVKNIPDSGSWLSFLKPFLTGYFSFILAFVLKLIFWLVSGTLVKYIVLMLLSPLFSLLSEATEEKLAGNRYPFNIVQLLKDILRGVGISLRNMLFEYLIMAGCFVLTIFFPPLGLITVPFLYFVSCYFTGFTMLDYNFERHKMSISQSIQFTRSNKGLTCGIGMAYSLLMLLPFAGFMFGPVIAVTGATISFMEARQNKLSVS